MSNGAFIAVCFIFAIVLGAIAVDYEDKGDEDRRKAFTCLMGIALWLATCAICWRCGYHKGLDEADTYHNIKSALMEVQK